jgi:lipopolysaccharide biosynthesis glycosyltransferase
MTSCDNNIVQYILPQLVSLQENMSDYDLHYYLVHCRIDPENVKMLEDFAKSNTGINFHEIKLEDTSLYEAVAINGGPWPCEAYFTLRVQDYMPDDVDRVWYIDAGDIVICGDAAPYYFTAFEGNSLIVTPTGYKKDSVSGTEILFTRDDIITLADRPMFNSGSYIIDVEKFRREGYDKNDYLYLSEALIPHAKHKFFAYLGDQGFLAAAFVEDMLLYGYPEIMDAGYMPYNYKTSFYGFFKRNPICDPVVLHYDIKVKPWVARFSSEVIDTIIDKPDFFANNLVAPIPQILYLTAQHTRHCETWWKYAKDTPIYNETNTKATITAESWINYLFPVCQQYNHFAKMVESAGKTAQRISSIQNP